MLTEAADFWTSSIYGGSGSRPKVLQLCPAVQSTRRTAGRTHSSNFQTGDAVKGNMSVYTHISTTQTK
jgi:hypothetical protein